MDTTGNLYGNINSGNSGPYGYGAVFQLTPSNGGWIYTDLHDFTGQGDGGYPWGSPVVDATGSLYGTTQVGGGNIQQCVSGAGCGIVWQITP